MSPTVKAAANTTEYVRSDNITPLLAPVASPVLPMRLVLENLGTSFFQKEILLAVGTIIPVTLRDLNAIRDTE